MNTMTFEPIRCTKDMPWFDEYSKHNKLCKIYNDGSSYVAVPVGYQCNKKQRTGSRLRTSKDEVFEQLYFEALKSNVSKERLSSYILEGMKQAFPDEWGLTEFVQEKLVKISRNIAVRKKRFRRKAYLNRWNYFVTLTYDDDKLTEEEFRKKLSKCLSNLHSRRGWLYMGVWERAPETQRLHFHGIFYVPDGQMVGKVFERNEYSTRKHKMILTHGNTFFEERFGRSDFEALSDVELRRGNTIKYLLKYLEKTEEKIVYSRGIPTDFFMVVNDSDIICELEDFVIKYILFDDVIDYETNILQGKLGPDVVINYDFPPS